MTQHLILFFLLMIVGCTNKSKTNYDLLIKNVNLIDGTGNPMKQNVNVYIKDEKILAVTEELIGDPDTSQIIDGTGKYLPPGIIDAHVHLATPGKIEYGEKQFPNTLKQLIHYGVTSVLIPDGSFGTYQNFQALSQNDKKGIWTSPRIYYTSLMCTTKGGHPMKMYTSKHYEDNVNVHIVRDTNHIKEIDEEVNSLKDEDGKAAAQSKQMMMGVFGNDTISLKTAVGPSIKDLKTIYKKGVNIVLGTDVGGALYIFPGYSAHEEMQLLQMGGFEPVEIIRIATHNGAKMLGILDQYGTIEKGKYADLILLHNNPLEDISNTLSIGKVFKGGKIQPRVTKKPV